VLCLKAAERGPSRIAGVNMVWWLLLRLLNFSFWGGFDGGFVGGVYFKAVKLYFH